MDIQLFQHCFIEQSTDPILYILNSQMRLDCLLKFVYNWGSHLFTEAQLSGPLMLNTERDTCVMKYLA